MKKRILAFVLSLVMLLGMVPTTAMAAQGEALLTIDGSALGLSKAALTVMPDDGWASMGAEDLSVLLEMVNSVYEVTDWGQFEEGNFYFYSGSGTVSAMNLGYLNEEACESLDTNYYTYPGYQWAFSEGQWSCISGFKFYIAVDGELFQGDDMLEEISISNDSNITIYLTLGEEPTVSIGESGGQDSEDPQEPEEPIPCEHSYGNPAIGSEPTKTTDGELVYTCSKCSDTYTETIPAGEFGECGPTLWYSYDAGTKTLTIVGKGALTSLTNSGGYQASGANRAPWVKNDYTDMTSIVLPEGVTSISRYAFHGCSEISSLTIPASVASVGLYLFATYNDVNNYGFEITDLSVRFLGCPDTLPNTFAVGVTNLTIIYPTDEEDAAANRGWADIEYAQNSFGASNVSYEAHCEHNFVEVPAKDATCAAEGNTAGTRCTICGKTFGVTVIKKPAHTPPTDASAITVTPATCTARATRTYTCTVCHESDVKEQYGSTLGHSWSGDFAVIEPTTKAQGSLRQKCTRCEETIERLKLPYLGAKEQVTNKALYTKQNIAPTCTEGGYTAWTYSKQTNYSNPNRDDGKWVFHTDRTEPAGHSYSGGVCTVCGCDCQHDYEETVTPPTCSAEGYTTKTCKICHEEVRDNYTEKLPHTNVKDEKASVPASCGLQGTNVFVCSVCGCTTTKPVPELTHDYQSDPSKTAVPATEDTEGLNYLKCTHCGATKTEKVPKLTVPRTLKIHIRDEQGKAQLKKSVSVKVGDVITAEKLGSWVEITERLGFTSAWYYSNAPIPEGGLEITSAMPANISVYLAYETIDYKVRINAGEHGVYNNADNKYGGYALCETEIAHREDGNSTVWEGRYDILGRGYGYDDVTKTPHASKTYNEETETYTATVVDPTADDGWYFVGWKITYYTDDTFTTEEPANGRMTDPSNTSNVTVGNPNKGNEIYGACMLTAQYINKAYVVKLPKGDSVLSGYMTLTNYNPAGYVGYAIELMGGTAHYATLLNSAEEVKAITGKDCKKFDNYSYNYYALPAGESFQFWVHTSAGFSQRIVADGDLWRYAYEEGISAKYEKHATDFLGNPSDRGTPKAASNGNIYADYADFTVMANNVELCAGDAVGSGAANGGSVAYSLGGYKDSAANIADFDRVLAGDKDGVIEINIPDMKPNVFRIKASDTGTKLVQESVKAGDPKHYEIRLTEQTKADKSVYAGKVSRFQFTDSAKDMGRFDEAIDSVYWGSTFRFTVHDPDGKLVKTGIRVSVANRAIYDRENYITYYHYGTKCNSTNGEWITLYPDATGVYTCKYTVDYDSFGTLNIKIEDFGLEEFKKAAVQELSDYTKLNFTMNGSGTYDDVLRMYIDNFWTPVIKGNIGVSGTRFVGSYLINGEMKTAEEAQAYVEALPEPPAGQSNYFRGWSYPSMMWGAYHFAEDLDAVGAASLEVLKGICSAKSIQELRAVMDKEAGAMKEVVRTHSVGVYNYEQDSEKKLATKLEKEYAAEIAESGYAVAEVTLIDEASLKVNGIDTFVVNVANIGKATDRVSAKLGAEALRTLANNGKALTIDSPVAKVALSAEAVKNIADSDRMKAGGFVAASSAVYINVTGQSASETMGLTDAQIKTIGKHPVFDLTVTNARGSVISLGGAAVTVSVPYTLMESENVENIRVWYINNLGEAEYVGIDSYAYDAAGQLWVTFTTTHFSAYVVAKAVARTVTKTGYTSRTVSLAKKTSLTVTGLESRALYGDVLGAYWAYDAINYVSQQGWMSGTSGKFNPDKAMTCGELLTIFAKASDTELSADYNSSDVLTRGRLAAMGCDFAKLLGVNMGLGENFDEAEALAALSAGGMMIGSGRANATADRATVAYLLYKLAMSK